MRRLCLPLLVTISVAVSAGARARPVETLSAIGGLPAHIAGQFSELSSCQQTPEGTQDMARLMKRDRSR